VLRLHYSHARGNFAVTRVKKGQKANNFTLLVKRVDREEKVRTEGRLGCMEEYKRLQKSIPFIYEAIISLRISSSFQGNLYALSCIYVKPFSTSLKTRGEG
jgi:hypothetical protein